MNFNQNIKIFCGEVDILTVIKTCRTCIIISAVIDAWIEPCPYLYTYVGLSHNIFAMLGSTLKSKRKANIHDC